MKHNKVNQEKPHTRRNKYQSTDSTLATYRQPYIHPPTHICIRAHKLSHTYKIKESNIKVRVTGREPPLDGQWQNHWGLNRFKDVLT